MPWIEPEQPDQLQALSAEIEVIKADIAYLKTMSKNNRHDLDINSLATIAFFALSGITSLFLLSLKNIGGVEVAPLEALRVISEVLAVPALGGVLAAVSAYIIKKLEKTD